MKITNFHLSVLKSALVVGDQISLHYNDNYDTRTMVFETIGWCSKRVAEKPLCSHCYEGITVNGYCIDKDLKYIEVKDRITVNKITEIE